MEWSADGTAEDMLGRMTHRFAGNPLDRGERERRDEQWVKEQEEHPASRFLPVSDLNILVSDGESPELRWLTSDEKTRLGIQDNIFFLGTYAERSHFVVDVSGLEAVTSQLCDSGGWKFQDARTAGENLSALEAGMVAQARSQVAWHSRHGFCSVCGEKTEVGRGGGVRRCPACGSEHFPRTDPVVIVVVHDGERCLLGQSRNRAAFRGNRFSALAGFMDQGESVEEAVAREVMEESGIRVRNVRYHSSQPWPFPSSLMIGCHAEAASQEIAMDDEEMADVRWFSREEVLLALEGRSTELTVPGPIAIAHHLLKTWAHRDIDPS